MEKSSQNYVFYYIFFFNNCIISKAIWGLEMTIP